MLGFETLIKTGISVYFLYMKDFVSLVNCKCIAATRDRLLPVLQQDFCQRQRSEQAFHWDKACRQGKSYSTVTTYLSWTLHFMGIVLSWHYKAFVMCRWRYISSCWCLRPQYWPALLSQHLLVIGQKNHRKCFISFIGWCIVLSLDFASAFAFSAIFNKFQWQKTTLFSLWTFLSPDM